MIVRVVVVLVEYQALCNLDWRACDCYENGTPKICHLLKGTFENEFYLG